MWSAYAQNRWHPIRFSMLRSRCTRDVRVALRDVTVRVRHSRVPPWIALNAKRSRATSTASSRHSSSAESWRKISAQGSSKSRNDVRFTARWSRRLTSVHRKRSATELTTIGKSALRTLVRNIHWSRLHSSSCQSISRRRWRRRFQRPSRLRNSAELKFICSRSSRLVGLRSSMPKRTPDWAAE